MEKLYDLILTGIQGLSNTQNDTAKFSAYLRSLQPKVRELRKGYGNNHVTVDYSNPETQAAYLITYYPVYAEMTYNVFNRSCNILSQEKIGKVKFSLRGHQEGNADFRSTIRIPQIITTNLLNGSDGLMPRRNIKCNFLSTYKLYTEELELVALATHQQDDWQENYILIQKRIQSLEENNRMIKESLKTLQNYFEQKNLEFFQESQSTIENINNQMISLQLITESFDINLKESNKAIQNNVNKKLANLQISVEEKVNTLSQDQKKYDILTTDSKIKNLENLFNILEQDYKRLIFDCDHIKFLTQQLEKRINEVDRSLHISVQEERNNIKNQIKVFRTAIIFSSIISFMSLLIVVFSLIK